MKKNTCKIISQKECTRINRYIKTLEHTNIYLVTKALQRNGSIFEPVFKVDYFPDCYRMPKYVDASDILIFMSRYPDGITNDNYLRELVKIMEI